MSQDNDFFASSNKNRSRVRITICGTRPLIQHAFGPESIALEKQEKTGVAGNDPQEWKKTCMVNPEGQLFLRGSYIFGMLRNAAKHTKKGRGSIQTLVQATLQVEEQVVLIDRFMPSGEPTHNDYTAPVYIDVCGVRNPMTKGRNVRYRLACSPGWGLSFTIQWDRTLVSRDNMKEVLLNAGILVGLADGVSIGNGRFQVTNWEELDSAETTPAARSVDGTDATANLEKGRQKVRPVRANAQVDGVPH